jgi:hypothetical protein
VHGSGIAKEFDQLHVSLINNADMPACTLVLHNALLLSFSGDGHKSVSYMAHDGNSMFEATTSWLLCVVSRTL